MQTTIDQADVAPLTRRGQALRALGALLLAGMFWAPVADRQWSQDGPWFWMDLLGGFVGLAVVLRYRRRWPLGVVLFLQALGLVSVSSGGAGVLALVSLGTRRRYPELILAGITNVLFGQLSSYVPAAHNSDPPWVNFTVVLVATVALIAVGMYIGSRRELVWSLRERASQAEAEQELRVAQARSAERERIAREMHDVLAHKISLLSMHAGALTFREDLDPAQIRQTAEVIQDQAHEALEDLRHVLGILRAQGGSGDRPQPTLADLNALIEQERAGGMPLEAEILLEEPRAGGRVGRTVYRIVQEGLTNARKHAPASPVRLEIRGGPEDGVSVRVANELPGTAPVTPPPGAGLGLVGLRERIELAGGELRITSAPDSFELRCWVPWTS